VSDDAKDDGPAKDAPGDEPERVAEATEAPGAKGGSDDDEPAKGESEDERFVAARPEAPDAKDDSDGAAPAADRPAPAAPGD
jgi:hypothetical protein